MHFTPFFRFLPEVADKEMRIVKVFGDSPWDLPEDVYGFFEMFCSEKQCDCRRVFFNVMTERQGSVATIAYGWETTAFYARWLGINDRSVIKEMLGPILNVASPQSRIAPQILRMFNDILLVDVDYISSVRRHYKLMKDKINAMSGIEYSVLADEKGIMMGNSNILPFPMPVRNINRSIGRNDQCPCGSGKKFKQCCLGMSR